jgi:superfamily I DNA/RNA helicase
VAIADYQSEADEDASAREREETKRLLYVALTRGRDRLYLSATAKDGKCRMGRGSLGEVLPDAVKRLFVDAGGTGNAGDNNEVVWAGASGMHHRLATPRASKEPRRFVPSVSAPAFVDDFEPLG